MTGRVLEQADRSLEEFPSGRQIAIPVVFTLMFT